MGAIGTRGEVIGTCFCCAYVRRRENNQEADRVFEQSFSSSSSSLAARRTYDVSFSFFLFLFFVLIFIVFLFYYSGATY